MSRKKKVLPYNTDVTSGTEGAILAKLVRNVLFELGIDRERYEDLIQRYVHRTTVDANVVERAAVRSSLNKELMKGSITFKTLFKFIALFLRVPNFDLVLRLHHANGRTTEHQVSVSTGEVLSTPRPPDEETSSEHSHE